MAKIRCSNCEKSVQERLKTGKVNISKICNATGEKINGNDYYKVRKCSEFFARTEYADQFGNTLDKAMEMIEKGKRIRDIVDPL